VRSYRRAWLCEFVEFVVMLAVVMPGQEAMMTLMPAFHRHAQEAAIIGRLLMGYGELEFMLSGCLGRVLEDMERAQRTLFVIRGETNRLRIAEELTRYPYFQKKLGAEFTGHERDGAMSSDQKSIRTLPF
jgi:hypothetical protein